MPIYTISNLQFSSQFLERPYKGVGVLWRLITVSSAGLWTQRLGVSLPTGPSEVLIWKALPVVVWTAHIVPEGGFRDWHRFPPLGWLLPYSDHFGFLSLLGNIILVHCLTTFAPTSLTGPKCSSFINVAGMAQGTATQCLLNKAILFHHHITLVQTLFFTAKTFLSLPVSYSSGHTLSIQHH